MYFKANNRYLVRIYYYRNRIALEAHHSLGDGTGGHVRIADSDGHLSAPEGGIRRLRTAVLCWIF